MDCFFCQVRPGTEVAWRASTGDAPDVVYTWWICDECAISLCNAITTLPLLERNLRSVE